MARRLKKISDQTIVITGASSGIGLATARLAAQRGARVVLASRNTEELERLVERIRRDGGRAIAVSADVVDTDAVQAIADRAIGEFGGFDTWINNAGVSIYGKLTEVPMEEKRRMFDVNFWGVVNGCRSAVRHLRDKGGAIINIGSVLSDRAIPLQGIYGASKHAVKAYTDTLRMELEADGSPISVTLIKPAAIATPYTEHARNHMESRARNAGPLYAPEMVARAILSAAEHPKRDIYAGGAGKLFSWMEKFIPRATDRIMEKSMFSSQKSDGAPLREDSLFLAPRREGHAWGDQKRHVRKSSLYTEASLHPIRSWLGFAAITGLGILAVRMLTERSRAQSQESGEGLQEHPYRYRGVLLASAHGLEGSVDFARYSSRAPQTGHL